MGVIIRKGIFGLRFDHSVFRRLLRFYLAVGVSSQFVQRSFNNLGQSPSQQIANLRAPNFISAICARLEFVSDGIQSATPMKNNKVRRCMESEKS